MIFIVLLSVIPKFINVYGIKIIIDLITRQASFADIVFAILFLVIGESVYYLFGGLYNNIIIPKSDIKIKKFLNDKMGLKEKILGSANGLDSKITKEFDKEGLVLSGGEMQKLMLARILAQPQPVIILDEPSSALDPMSETSFFDDIIKNIRDKTVIFITHRLNAAKNADKIILLRNGRIIQTGTHRRLISEDGEYKNMYEMQAKRYELDPDEKIII